MDRRSFMKVASWGALAELTGVSPLRSISALAQSSSSTDYKALICLFLRGGNDSNNMIIPMTSSQFAIYNAARPSLSLSQGSLLQLPGVAYALNPNLTNMQRLYSAGNLAMVANVGPLVQPTTVSQYKNASAALPTALMSHDDQQQTWETGGYLSGTGPGWGGLTADALTPTYNSSNMPMVTLLGPATNFGWGNNTSAFTAVAGGGQASLWCSANMECYPRATAMQQILSFNTGVNLVQADQQIFQNTLAYNNFYNNVIGSAAGMSTQFPSSNPISYALQTVAKMIQLRNQIGARRQIFLIDAGGSFDTHADQPSQQPALFQQIDGALATFYSAMQELGVWNQVTMFSASDFSRTLVANSANGTDHAWGGHHFVVGGAVKGGMYGTFPDLTLNGQNDIDGSGRYVPTTALSQYAATLASWFGVSNSNLYSILPGLSNFSNINLKFV